jgi:hypothetical protein
MSPQWQLITGDHSRPELYDWVRDPRELQNQASSPDGQHVVSQLTARLRLRTATAPSELSRTAPAQPPAARQMASQFTTK